MELSSELLRQFAKAVTENNTSEKDPFQYGKVVKSGGETFVQLDGSEVITPVWMSADAKADDRVMVTIKNHIATIIGNLSSPALNSSSSYLTENFATVRNLSALNATVNSLSGNYANFVTATADNFSAVNGRIDNLSTVYLRATLANLDTANIDVAKVNDLYAATGLIKHVVISEGHVTDFLDTVQVNAASITAGILDASIIDVRNLNADNITVGTINGQRIADGVIDQTKLSNDLSEKIDSTVAGVTVMYALSNNTSTPPVSGWSETAPDWAEDMYMWQKTVTVYTDGTEEESVTCISGAAGQDGEDATILRIDSSRGTVFKNSSFSTIFTVVVWKGSLQITDIAALKAEYGAAAYLEWKWKRVEDEDFKTISISDPRLSRNGFEFTVTPDDVDEKIVFQCDLVI